MAGRAVIARRERIYPPSLKYLTFVVAIPMIFASSGFAAGVDSRAYTCAGLQALVATKGFVFIGNPEFQDFIVAGEYYCSGNERMDLRSIATSDNPQCPVQYCVTRPTVEGPS